MSTLYGLIGTMRERSHRPSLLELRVDAWHALNGGALESPERRTAVMIHFMDFYQLTSARPGIASVSERAGRRVDDGPSREASAILRWWYFAALTGM